MEWKPTCTVCPQCEGRQVDRRLLSRPVLTNGAVNLTATQDNDTDGLPCWSREEEDLIWNGQSLLSIRTPQLLATLVVAFTDMKFGIWVWDLCLRWLRPKWLCRRGKDLKAETHPRCQLLSMQVDRETSSVDQTTRSSLGDHQTQ